MPEMTYSQFNSIRNRAKKELLRRCYVGSVASYGNSITGSLDPNYILAKDVAPVVAGLLAINSLDDLGTVVQGSPIPGGFDYTKISDQLTAFEGYPLYGKGTDCAASCTGLCHTQCTGGCTSCSGCTGSCSGCLGSCKGGCTGGCDGCEHGCGGGCWSQCGSSCDSGCKGSR